MASKRNSHYHFIFFSDQHAEHRQFHLPRKWAISLMALAGLSALSLLVVGVQIVQTLTSGREVDELRKENQALKSANDRYLEASMEIERKLKVFDEKTNKLALYVGVSPRDVAGDGVGGAEPFSENELNQYLRYDLGLLMHKTQLVEQNLGKLDGLFNEHRESLDNTPSLLPARGWISSGFNYRLDPFTNQKTWHNGLDISAPSGTPVFAPAGGVVSFAGSTSGFGNLLVVNHGNSIETKYGHLSAFNVSVGQRIKRGDLIAYVGSTGRSTAPHLHYELYKGEMAVNPLDYILDETRGF